MKKRLRDIIDSLDYYELLRIKKDLNDGGFHLKNFLDAHITEREKDHFAVCAVCANEIDSESTQIFTLLFGPVGFKKKATFCGKDCLEYFLGNLENMRKGIVKHE